MALVMPEHKEAVFIDLESRMNTAAAVIFNGAPAEAGLERNSLLYPPCGAMNSV